MSLLNQGQSPENAEIRTLFLLPICPRILREESMASALFPNSRSFSFSSCGLLMTVSSRLITSSYNLLILLAILACRVFRDSLLTINVFFVLVLKLCTLQIIFTNQIIKPIAIRNIFR